MAGPLECWLWTARPPIERNHGRGNSWKNVLTAKLWLDPNGFDSQGDMSLHQLPATTHISSRAVTADAVRCHQHFEPSPADLASFGARESSPPHPHLTLSLSPSPSSCLLSSSSPRCLSRPTFPSYVHGSNASAVHRSGSYCLLDMPVPRHAWLLSSVLVFSPCQTRSPLLPGCCSSPSSTTNFAMAVKDDTTLTFSSTRLELPDSSHYNYTAHATMTTIHHVSCNCDYTDRCVPSTNLRLLDLPRTTQDVQKWEREEFPGYQTHSRPSTMRHSEPQLSSINLLTPSCAGGPDEGDVAHFSHAVIIVIFPCSSASIFSFIFSCTVFPPDFCLCYRRALGTGFIYSFNDASTVAKATHTKHRPHESETLGSLFASLDCASCDLPRQGSPPLRLHATSATTTILVLPRMVRLSRKVKHSHRQGFKLHIRVTTACPSYKILNNAVRPTYPTMLSIEKGSHSPLALRKTFLSSFATFSSLP
ncbi:hypothetical protein BDZ89DRAFT_1164574 [Hymenopellis radicata]|nr:hypothetical protein BDZ89DRAFT_1164574 [Hymenopellis radicata]